MNIITKTTTEMKLILFGSVLGMFWGVMTTYSMMEIKFPDNPSTIIIIDYLWIFTIGLVILWILLIIQENINLRKEQKDKEWMEDEEKYVQMRISKALEEHKNKDNTSQSG